MVLGIAVIATSISILTMALMMNNVIVGAVGVPVIIFGAFLERFVEITIEKRTTSD